MPIGATLGTPATLSLRDAGNEATSFQVWGAILTAANYAAQTALFDTLVTQAMDLVLGAKASTNYGNKVDFVWAQPENGAAAEIALSVSYRDATTGQKFTAKLGTLDPAIPDYVVNVNAKDVVQLTSPAVIVDFITAFDAFAKNPYTGNACEVIGLRVGRGQK